MSVGRHRTERDRYYRRRTGFGAFDSGRWKFVADVGAGLTADTVVVVVFGMADGGA